MKIKGPGGPQGPPDVEGLEKPERTDGTGFADRLDPTGAAGRTGGPGGPSGPGGPGGADPVAAVAADLRSGAITPRQAVDRLVDLAVAQGPAGQLPERVKAKIRADLERLVAEDPYLASHARRLGLPGGEEG